MIALFQTTCAASVSLCAGNVFVASFCKLTCATCDTFCVESDAALQQWNRGVAVQPPGVLESVGTDVCVAPSVAATLQMPGFGNQLLLNWMGYRAFCPMASGECTLPATVSGRKDPHIKFAHGGRADFRGEDGGIFNLLSASNVSMNVRTEQADFHWAHQLVHGTRIGAAFWTIRALDGAIVTIAFESPSLDAAPDAARVALEGEHAMTIKPGGRFVHSDVHVSYGHDGDGSAGGGGGSGAALNVTNTRWTFRAAPSHFPYARSNPHKRLLDVSATPLYEADADVVAPHGIFGQSFDGDEIAVDGAVDVVTGGGTASASASSVKERTTAAQAEGAIEGTLADYKMATPFAVEFKYSRFHGVPAKHRDVSKLTGRKRPRETGEVAAAAEAFAPGYLIGALVAQMPK